METPDFLLKPVSDSVLLQILVYQQAFSPTWGCIPGEQGRNQLGFLRKK